MIDGWFDVVALVVLVLAGLFTVGSLVGKRIKRQREGRL